MNPRLNQAISSSRFCRASVGLKNQNPAIWRLRGFRFGCGDLQPSQIALRGDGLMILGVLTCACLLNVRWNQNPATYLVISMSILNKARNSTLDASIG